MADPAALQGRKFGLIRTTNGSSFCTAAHGVATRWAALTLHHGTKFTLTCSATWAHRPPVLRSERPRIPFLPIRYGMEHRARCATPADRRCPVAGPVGLPCAAASARTWRKLRHPL